MIEYLQITLSDLIVHYICFFVAIWGIISFHVFIKLRRYSDAILFLIVSFCGFSAYINWPWG